MKQRLVSLLLVGVMAAGLLTGCGESGKKDGKEESQSSVSETSSVSGTSSESSKDEGPKELTTVKILCTNEVRADVYTEDWEQHDVSQVFIKNLEEIGIRLELECIDSTSLANVISTRMAAGVDVPDLIAYPGNYYDQVIEYSKSGLVYSVNELLEEYDEDGSIRAYYEETAPGVWESMTAPDGNVYWFNYLYGELEYEDPETGIMYTGRTGYAIQLRKDWVEAVGEEFQEVYSADELCDLLIKMTQEDTNGDGQQNESIAVNVNNFANGLALGFGLNNQLLCGYFNDDNVVFSNFYHENFPAYIEFMQKLYNAGAIDTLVLSSADQVRAENRGSIVYGYGSTEYEKDLYEIDSDAQYMSIYFDMDGDITNGFHVSTDSPGPKGYYCYFVPQKCENPEAVVRLMDYIYTDEYALLDRYGIEGVNYEWPEDSAYPVSDNVAGDGTLWDAGVGLKALPAIVKWGGLKDRHGDNESTSRYLKKEWAAEFMMTSVNYASTTYGLELAIASEEEMATMNEIAETLNTYASELLVELIMGEKSLDDLPKYQAEMEELGLSTYVEIVQARRNRMIGAE